MVQWPASYLPVSGEKGLSRVNDVLVPAGREPGVGQPPCTAHPGTRRDGAGSGEAPGPRRGPGGRGYRARRGRPGVPGLYEALTGGSLASDAEKLIAARIAEIAPLTRTMLNASRACHARAAAEAAARAMPVVAVQCHYPGYLSLHADADGRRRLLPDGRPLPVVYAASDGRVIRQVRRRLADPHGGIHAVRMDADDPAGLLAVPEVAALTRGTDGLARPVQLHLPMILEWLDAGACRRMLGDLAALLPAGSQLVITVTTGLTTPLGQQWADLAAEAGQLQQHTTEDLYSWCDQAGLWLDGPMSDVRAGGEDWAAEGLDLAPRRTGRRVMSVTARIPDTPVPPPSPGNPQVIVLGTDEWVVVPEESALLSPARLGVSVGRHPGPAGRRSRHPVLFMPGLEPAALPGPAVLHYADGHAIVRCRPGHFDGRAAHLLSQAGSLAAALVAGRFGNPSVRVNRASHSDRGPWHPAACEPGSGRLVVTLCENLVSSAGADCAGRLLGAHLEQLARRAAAAPQAGQGRLLAS